MSGKNSVIFCFFFRHKCKKSLWKNMFLVSSNSRTPPLVCAPPQLTLPPSPTTCLRFGDIQSPDKFTGNPKIVSHLTSSQEILNTQINIYIYIAHHLDIYEVNFTAQYLPRQQKHPYKAIYQQRVSTCHR